MRSVIRSADGSGTSVRILDSSQREQALRLWGALERELGAAPALSCSSVWTAAWLDQYGGVVDHSFAVMDGAADNAKAIALLTRASAASWHPRTWHLGTAGEPHRTGVFVERNRVLCRPVDRGPFIAGLLEYLQAEQQWDRLRLDGLHADDAADFLIALGGESDHVVATVEQSPIADLQDGDDVLAALSGSRRQRIRRTLKAFGELELTWAQDAAGADAIMSELIELHQRRWTEAGDPGSFSAPRFEAFHRALAAELVPAGKVGLVRVHRGEETVGCLYGHIDGDRLCFYQGGLQRYDDNRLRAGVAAHVTFMRACRERGLRSYDFLAPAARYKEELASREEQLTWIEVRRSSNWRLRARRAVRALRPER